MTREQSPSPSFRDLEGSHQEAGGAGEFSAPSTQAFVRQIAGLPASAQIQMLRPTTPVQLYGNGESGNSGASEVSVSSPNGPSRPNQPNQPTRPDRAATARQLRQAVSRLRNSAIGEREGHRALIRARREHWIVGALSESAGGAGSMPEDQIWEPILAHIARAEEAISGFQGSADGGAAFLETIRAETAAAERGYRDAVSQLQLYRERTEDGAQSRIETLEGVVATCALVATICASAAAIPLATGGGLAGANAVGASAVGAATAPVGGIAATSGAGLGLQSIGAGVGAGGMALATTTATQAGEMATQQRDHLDLGAIYEASSEAAANAVIGTLLGGAMSRAFVTPLT
ncbi:MAG: hypothetical protein KC561_07395, partial [Myxococcales bacterium]|nr:hypothetical protein [Myxococcales bacterium]